MYILLGILLAILGAAMVINPRFFIQLRDKWRYDTDVEPSKFYIFEVRFGGVMFLLVGIVCTVILLIFK